MQMSREKANAILETIPNAIIVTNDHGKIEHFNLAAEPLFQQLEEDVLGQEIKTLIPDLNIFEAKGDIKRQEMFLLYKSSLKGLRGDNVMFPIEIAAGEITLDQTNHWVFSIRDITQRLKMENETAETRERLLRTERLAALGGMVAGISHEINTPLGISITAASHMQTTAKTLQTTYKTGQLKRSSLSQYFEDFDEAMNILNTNLLRAAELIRSFKLVSVDQSSEKKRMFGLKSYINDVILSLKPQLKKSKVTLDINCPSTFFIHSYPGVIAQIVSNFILNSLLHGFDAGQNGIISIQVLKQNDYFVLNYRDNGKGIPKENINHIFDPFFTTKRGDGGSGLGLHIVYNLVTQRLNGKIACQSEPDKGVHFILEIPIEVEQQS